MPKRIKKNNVKIIKTSNKECCYKVLGLDCSSSMVGWGLVGLDKDKPILLAYGHIKPLDSKNHLLERLNDVCNKILNVCEDIIPTEVVIEDIIMHMAGKSQASTIIILASFNRVIATVVFRESKLNVFWKSVQSIRKEIKKNLGLKEVIKKEDMPYIIKKYLSESFEFTLNKKGQIADVTRDEADGIAVAWSRLLEKINAEPI